MVSGDEGSGGRFGSPLRAVFRLNKKDLIVEKVLGVSLFDRDLTNQDKISCKKNLSILTLSTDTCRYACV